jgi:hypothetical protein
VKWYVSGKNPWNSGAGVPGGCHGRIAGIVLGPVLLMPRMPGPVTCDMAGAVADEEADEFVAEEEAAAEGKERLVEAVTCGSMAGLGVWGKGGEAGFLRPR